jgi:hypothetical protein
VGLVVLCVKYWLGKEQKSLLQIRMGQQLKKHKASSQVKLIEASTGSVVHLLPLYS